jgi:uridine phosphorylase
VAQEPKDSEGRPYHLRLRKADVGKVALLPGDPARVPVISKKLQRSAMLSSNREYTAWGGFVGRDRVTVVSTGIGGPATAIAVEELARLGVRVMIRVGTCGAIVREARVGSVVIADSAVRMDGTSAQYVPLGYPAAASPGVVFALQEAASSVRAKARVGIAASTDSFYVGQGRESYGGYFPSDKKGLIEDLRAANVLCFEMEASTLFTLGRIFGLKTGAVLGVVANRATNEFRPGAGVDSAIAIAVNAVTRLKKFGVF